jgi:hypothetical protein
VMYHDYEYDYDDDDDQVRRVSKASLRMYKAEWFSIAFSVIKYWFVFSSSL